MDEQARLRRKDTTKGPPLRVLSLDGGGVRGYSMLIILQELMHKTFVEIEGRPPKRHEIPKPCDHFDLIAGTGTGGLIAIMLGRLRLDLDTCKDVYVRMTRRVFETDKTFLGMPLKGTMFKASKLEESIREVAREHTIFEDEGNDSLANATPLSPNTPISVSSNIPSIPQRTMSQSSRYSQAGMSPTSGRVSYQALKFGNPNTLLYDTRENRTKTAVTAVLKGTKVTTLLRSYDSRKEPAPDVNCTIWQAGRATSATQMAFKPIQIGQSVYLDDGAGKYNPAPQVLDEAVQNEWPGRQVGLFVSIGTGKRPPGSNKNAREWWEELGGTMSDFAEARRRLMSKIEGCEDSHKFMLDEHLAARGVNVENYIRLNVEVGVGEMGMNEWDRLSEMTINTRSYLSRKEVQALSLDAAAKLARVHFAKVRHDRAEARKQAGTDGPQFNQSEFNQNSWERPQPFSPPPANPMVVELPGDDTFVFGQQYGQHPSAAEQKYGVEAGAYYIHRPSIADQKYTVTNSYDQRPTTNHTPHNYSPQQHPPRISPEHNSVRFSSDTVSDASPRQSQDFNPQSPPPVPPKTPVNGSALPYPDAQHHRAASTHSTQSQNAGPRTFMNMGELGRRLPYPDTAAGLPPTVNMANKPTLPQ